MNSLSKNTLIALSVAGIISGCNDTQVNTVDKPPRPVNVIELGAENGTYQQYFAGRLESVDEADVSFRVPGTIEEIYVVPGDEVKKGDKLAQLDAHDYQVALMELQARLSEAVSAHQLAESELRRVRQALSDNAIAKVNLDRAKSGYERSKAAVDVVKQNIKKAEDAIRYTVLLAPFDGVIGQQHADKFEQILPGVAVFQVHKPSMLQAVVDVPESLIKRFDYGQSVNVFWNDSSIQLPAVISEISTVPHPIKQTYSVVFELTGHDDAVLPGKAVVVEAQFSNQAGVYCLPYSAVFTHGEEKNVYLVKEHKTMVQPVRVRHLLSDEVCVSGALASGDKVITSGVGYLKDNQVVGELIAINGK